MTTTIYNIYSYFLCHPHFFIIIIVSILIILVNCILYYVVVMEIIVHVLENDTRPPFSDHAMKGRLKGKELALLHHLDAFQ